ncbi:MAG TPA: phenylacetic acid degradation protein [Promineifilum sp.]|nr:phenylacetic acid degradation protein [Promineifilum sp.]
MNDQWPRYEVFKQERDGGPFRNVGSVHAPDAEMALLNARDVFARRPACRCLWVVPAAAIVATPIVVNAAGDAEPDDVSGPLEPYAVCGKSSERQAMTYVDYLGRVEARSAAEALRAAPALGAARIWWVFPERVISRSDPEDAPGLEAATGKLFRMSNQYHTVVTMQKIRRGDEGEE